LGTHVFQVNGTVHAIICPTTGTVVYGHSSRAVRFGRNHACRRGLKPTLFALLYGARSSSCGPSRYNSPVAGDYLQTEPAGHPATLNVPSRRLARYICILLKLKLLRSGCPLASSKPLQPERLELTRKGQSRPCECRKQRASFMHPPNGHHSSPADARCGHRAPRLCPTTKSHSSATVSESDAARPPMTSAGFRTRGSCRHQARRGGWAVGGGVPVFSSSESLLAFSNYIRELGKTKKNRHYEQHADLRIVTPAIFRSGHGRHDTESAGAHYDIGC